MGEMADLALSEILDLDELCDNYDYELEPGEPWIGGGVGRSYKVPTSLKCKWCGKYNLIWKKTDKGWRLADNAGNIHTCDYKSTIMERIKGIKNGK